MVGYIIFIFFLFLLFIGTFDRDEQGHDQQFVTCFPLFPHFSQQACVEALSLDNEEC